MHKKNSKAIWNLLNVKLGNSSLNKTRSTPHINPDDLNNVFAELGPKTKSHIKPINQFNIYLNDSVTNSFFILPVTPNEVINACNLFPPKISCGYDEIPMKVIKAVKVHIASPLSIIFNKSFQQGKVPKALKIAKICPIFKSGEISDPKNYRPISLLPSFSKLLEKLMYTRLISFISTNSTISQSQHGFMPSRSTSSATAELLNTITSALDKKHIAIVLFTDISKAFDSQDHNILLCKLEYYGIRGIALQWFCNYLSPRFHFTQCNNKSSMCRLKTSGVPQGSVLSTTILYNIYVNDIFHVNPNAKCVLYADETAIILSGKTVNDLSNNAIELFHTFSV